MMPILSLNPTTARLAYGEARWICDNIGKHLTKVRLDRGMSSYQVAKELRLKVSTITRLEAGGTPSYGTLMAVLGWLAR
jgi:ribosome-binding protein aMBF1 (putative translation factor)